MLITSLYCEDCQNNYQLDDEFEKNKTIISKYECDDYAISLIKKTHNNEFDYSIIFNCKNCNKNITQTFTTKENTFLFKCYNCKNLKGLTLYYFLSLEEDSMAQNEPKFLPKNENNIKKSENLNSSTAPPAFQQERNNSIPINNNPSEFNQHKNENDLQNQFLFGLKPNEQNINIPFSEINRMQNMISQVVPKPKIGKTEAAEKEKIYKTPGKKINVTFNNPSRIIFSF